MSSAFFRRPTDASSDSSSTGGTSEEDSNSHPQVEDVVDEGDATANTESLASHGSEVVGDGQNPATSALPHVDHHRNNLLSALLEDFAKTRACEMMNSARPGVRFTRSSAEVQPLARKLYQHLSQSLTLGGLLPASVANDSQVNQQTRAAYLAGIESLSLSGVQNSDALAPQNQQRLSSPDELLAITRSTHQRQGSLPESLQQQMASLSFFQSPDQFPSPYSNVAFPLSPPHQSHYDSSFQQLGLLGKGGFGRVYHTYNIFDKKEYAVKKIPLSPRLSERYRESGHKELENLLREVQALAQLEHNNVVRYHATWIEEPRRMPGGLYSSGTRSVTVNGRRLLAEVEAPATQSQRLVSESDDHGIVFGTDSTSQAAVANADAYDVRGPTWTLKDSEPESLSARTSDIFTDGISRPSIQQEVSTDDSVYVLHVQMSVYPMTLAHYLAPPSSKSQSAPGRFRRRHCFHLVPALRILMGILCGLQYIHAKGLVHRDIKPSNIFLCSLDDTTTGVIPDGYHDVGSCIACPDSGPYFINPRIGDFGLVADVARENGLEGDSGQKNHSKPVGTEYYRPPGRSDMIDEKLDVFALGVVLVEMLWCCPTNSERLQILRDIQKGVVPAGLVQKIDGERHGEGTGNLVVQGILGMIAPDRRRRWSCADVSDWAETVLKKCTDTCTTGNCNESHSPDSSGGGTILTKVVTLEGGSEV